MENHGKPNHTKKSQKHLAPQEPNDIKILLDERKRVEDLTTDINQRLFQTIAAVVIPLTVAFGYALLNYNSEVRFIILVIPLIIILAILLIGVIFTELYVTGNYVRHLSCLLNSKLPNTPLLLEKLRYDFIVRGLSLQTAFLVLSVFFFCAIDILCLILAPKILGELTGKIAKFCSLEESQKGMVRYAYWTFIYAIHLFLFISFLIQYYFKAKKLKETIANRNWEIYPA